MESEIAREIRKNVRRYLDGKIRLHEFEDFFVPILWDIEEQQGEADLAGRIHVLTAEYSRGDRSLQSLHEELESAIRPFALRVKPTFYSKPMEIAINKPQEFNLTFDPARAEFGEWMPIPGVPGELVPRELFV